MGKKDCKKTNTFILSQFMVQSWPCWHLKQSRALCIPHLSQAPVKPLEVWLEHGLQAIVCNKISDNVALCVQRRSSLSKNCFTCSYTFTCPAKLTTNFISSSSPWLPPTQYTSPERAGNPKPAREGTASAHVAILKLPCLKKEVALRKSV